MFSFVIGFSLCQFRCQTFKLCISFNSVCNFEFSFLQPVSWIRISFYISSIWKTILSSKRNSISDAAMKYPKKCFTSVLPDLVFSNRQQSCSLATQILHLLQNHYSSWATVHCFHSSISLRFILTKVAVSTELSGRRHPFERKKCARQMPAKHTWFVCPTQQRYVLVYCLFCNILWGFQPVEL